MRGKNDYPFYMIELSLVLKPPITLLPVISGEVALHIESS